MLSPLPIKGDTGHPWVGLHDGSRWRWRKSLSNYGPGRVNYWSVLSRYRALKADAIVVVTDPGPFTASRAAVSIANALGYAWDVPVVSATARDLQRTLPNLLVERAHPRLGQKPGFLVAERALPKYNRKPY